LVYWHFFASGLAGFYLNGLLNSKNYYRASLSILIIYISVLSGFLDVFNLTKFNQQKYQLFTRDTVKFAGEIRRISEPDAVFLTAPTNTWLGMVLGRQIIMGFTPWLENFGMTNIDKRRIDIEKIYTGAANAKELIRNYSLDFIIIGPVENSIYKINRNFFRDLNSPVLENPEYAVYDVRKFRIE
jgi:hypothetical protein